MAMSSKKESLITLAPSGPFLTVDVNDLASLCDPGKGGDYVRGAVTLLENVLDRAKSTLPVTLQGCLQCLQDLFGLGLVVHLEHSVVRDDPKGVEGGLGAV